MQKPPAPQDTGPANASVGPATEGSPVGQPPIAPGKGNSPGNGAAGLACKDEYGTGGAARVAANVSAARGWTARATGNAGLRVDRFTNRKSL